MNEYSDYTLTKSKWIEDGGARGYICSYCNLHNDKTKIYNHKLAYCPDCKALMINGEVNE